MKKLLLRLFLIALVSVLLFSTSSCAKNQYTFDEYRYMLEQSSYYYITYDSSDKIELNRLEKLFYPTYKDVTNLQEIIIVFSHNHSSDDLDISSNTITKDMVTMGIAKLSSFDKQSFASSFVGFIASFDESISNKDLKAIKNEVNVNIERYDIYIEEKIISSPIKTKGSYIYFGKQDFLSTVYTKATGLSVTVGLLLYIGAIVFFFIFFNKKHNRKQSLNNNENTSIIDCSIEEGEDKKEVITIIDKKKSYTYGLPVAIIGIIIYFFMFNVLPTVITPLLLNIYLKVNGISKELINSSSSLFDTNVYNDMANTLNPILQLVIYLPTAIILFFVAKKFLFEDFKRATPKVLLYGLLGAGLVYASAILSNIFLTILDVTGESSNEEAINGMLTTPTNIMIMFFCTVFLAPFVEEIVFRKCFFKIFKNPVVAITISSILFGGIHVFSSTTEALTLLIKGSGTYLEVVLELIQIIPYSTMGLAMGIAYLMSNKNIYSSIFTHFLNNSVAMILQILLIFFSNFTF